MSRGDLPLLLYTYRSTPPVNMDKEFLAPQCIIQLVLAPSVQNGKTLRSRNSFFHRKIAGLPPFFMLQHDQPHLYTFKWRPQVESLHKSSNSLSFVHQNILPDGPIVSSDNVVGPTCFAPLTLCLLTRVTSPPVVYPYSQSRAPSTLRWTYKLPSVVRLRSLQRARTGMTKVPSVHPFCMQAVGRVAAFTKHNRADEMQRLVLVPRTLCGRPSLE